MPPLSADEFDRLLREALPSAIRLAQRLCGPGRHGEAEDVVSEALLAAARGWRSWRGWRGESSFRVWLCGVVVNQFRQQERALRRRRRSEKGRSAPPNGAPATPVERLAALEMRGFVAEQVSQLPPRQRAVVALVVYEQMTAEEAAQALETTAGNIRVLLHHARGKLRSALMEKGYA